MSPSKTTSAPLAELSPNTTSPSKSAAPVKSSQNLFEKMPATAAFPIHNRHTPNYISPSDAMMSPASKKLSEIKGRRLASAKTTKLNSRALFANARAMNEKDSAASSQAPSETESQSEGQSP